MAPIKTIVALTAALAAFAGPALADGCTSNNPFAQYTIHLEFGGYQDSSYEIAGQTPVSVDVPAFQGGQAIEDEICERVAEDFAPFDVNVTASATGFTPGLRRGAIAAIGGQGGEIGVRGNTSSALEHVAILTEFYGNGDPIPPKEIGASISHEMGHILASWTAVPMSHYTPARALTTHHDILVQGKTQIMGGTTSESAREIWWKDEKTLVRLIPDVVGVPQGCYRQVPDEPDSPWWCCGVELECTNQSDGIWQIGFQDDIAILLAALGAREDAPRGPVPYGANAPDQGEPLRSEGVTPAGDERLAGAGIIEMNPNSIPRTCSPWGTASCFARRYWNNPPEEKDFFKFRVAGDGTFKVYVVTQDEMDPDETKANLDAGIELYRKVDNVWNIVTTGTELHGASDLWAGLELSITARAQHGLYAIAAKSEGEYGDLGQYTVRVEGPNVESIINSLRVDEEQELTGLNLGSNDLWYKIEADQNGPFSVVANTKDERANFILKLYDENLKEVETSDYLTAQIHHGVAKGELYFLQISGRSESLGLRFQIGGKPAEHPHNEKGVINAPRK